MSDNSDQIEPNRTRHPPRDIASQWPGRDVDFLILSGENFIVFLDSELDVDWASAAQYDATFTDEQTRELREVLNLAAAVECIPNSHLRKDVRLNFKRMIGEGVARALDRYFEGAKKILEEARLYIEARNVESARYWQLCTACSSGVLIGVSGLILWSFRNFFFRSWTEPTYFLVLAGGCGSIGAVLSMIFRMGRSFPTSDAPRTLHIAEAISKVMAGCISGLLAAGCVQIGLIIPADKTGHMFGTMLVLALTSGASERLAPSIISKLESDSENRHHLRSARTSKTKVRHFNDA